MVSSRPARRTTAASDDAIAHLVRGDDPSLVAQATRQLVTELAGDRDLTLVVEEHGSVGADDLDAAAVIDALTTPPFLADRRIVVVRDAGRLGASEAAHLADRLDTPVPGVRVVFAAGGGTLPAVLVKAVERNGVVIDTALRTGRDRAQWLADHLRAAPVRLNAAAAARLEEHLGSDVNRLSGLVDTLAAAYGVGATVNETQLAPFLGQPGTVSPWDLTDAIDAGRTQDALAMLTRLLGPGAFHPLALLGILHRHYAAMLRLDGAEVSTAQEAADLLGLRSAFPAKKAFERARQLGSARIGRAIVLLAGVDLDLRGRSALPGDVVLEVVVARLSRLARTRQPSGVSAGRRH